MKDTTKRMKRHTRNWEEVFSNRTSIKGLVSKIYERHLGLDEVEVAQSCPVLSDSLRPHGLHSPRDSPGQDAGVGSLSLLQGIFLTQGSNPGLPHCRWILYQLSHKGSPRILEWGAYPFSRGSSQPRDQTRVSCTACRFFAN